MSIVRRASAVVLSLAVAIAASAPARAEPGSPDLPLPSRRVPRHPIALLDGCSRADRVRIVERIGAAIEIGAPTYNAGDFLGCYRIYEAEARRIEGELSPSCSGPVRALRDGRGVAAGRRTDSERAWAMRDAFDGLLLVIDRAGGA